ncbi:MAG: ATP synthase subunit I [Rhodoferax sp.]|uniref:ATP synthase subunit I n=1 Tax=Rhodoferax sp. TaxID=50421 RepID=UPI0026120752|nr:ATP synthase subunit I [Rhodoferax sp.]MDD2880486.1 ATP synthase subunit I [Rhodoferax sp.]
MNNTLALLLAWMAGGALGAIFFGGLWWTVKKSLASAKPALWVFGSLLLRMGVTMTGFYLVSAGDWQRMFSCLVGFLLARQLVTRLTRLPEENQIRRSPEASHAP